MGKSLSVWVTQLKRESSRRCFFLLFPLPSFNNLHVTLIISLSQSPKPLPTHTDLHTHTQTCTPVQTRVGVRRRVWWCRQNTSQHRARHKTPVGEVSTTPVHVESSGLASAFPCSSKCLVTILSRKRTHCADIYSSLSRPPYTFFSTIPEEATC